MKLLLMRHGEAEPTAASDARRILTAYGREQVVAVARKVQALDIGIDGAMVSPYLRTRETAALFSSTLGGHWPEQVSDKITPDQSPGDAAEAISDNFRELATGLVVMHQPIISRLIDYLTGQEQPMGTASLAIIDAPFVARGSCELECVIWSR